MIEYRKTGDGKIVRIDEMSTEHLLKAIDVIKYEFDDWDLEWLSSEDINREEYEDRKKTIYNQYQAMHNELTVRLAKKLLLDDQK